MDFEDKKWWTKNAAKTKRFSSRGLPVKDLYLSTFHQHHLRAMSSNFNIRFYKGRSFTESKHWLKILHKSSSPRSRLADADLYRIYQSWNLYRTDASLAILPVEMIWIMTVLYSALKVACTEHCKQVLWWYDYVGTLQIRLFKN